jgi:hypothetical protein
LDDDDRLLNQFVINTLCKHITHPDVLLLWQVNLHDRVIPEPPYWGHTPQPGHITGIGFCFHVRHWVDWEPTHYGDYQVVKALYPKLRPVWIPEILTEMQTGPGLGNRKDLSDDYFPYEK